MINGEFSTYNQDRGLAITAELLKMFSYAMTQRDWNVTCTHALSSGTGRIKKG